MALRCDDVAAVQNLMEGGMQEIGLLSLICPSEDLLRDS
jgi:hypothetical protein